ncbi:MAG: GNAT family N-acetyltransferase [Anaerolineales bacterium]|nr:GNAT family N-acetyltransferase [Anaerolineales bacterium]
MTKLQTQEPPLDSTLNLRATKWADVNAVAQLIYDVCEADGDVTVAVTPDELTNQWKTEKFNPETDTYVIETQDGQIIGYGEFFDSKDHAHLNADIYVHPRFKGRGLIKTLLARVDERALEDVKLAAPGLRVFIRSSMDGKDEEAKKAHEEAGYFPVRFSWRMEIKLDEMPPSPVWPEGIELRPFVREEQSRAVLDAVNEAFRDHWGSHESTFEDWERSRFAQPDFDPSLWVIAWDGNEIAGFSLNRFRMGIGWVSTLGVRRPWRKKGLGLALLRQSFGEFYNRGMKTIGLGVDASNPTGATRLYQGAGMYIASEFITYDKELRAGKSLEE